MADTAVAIMQDTAAEGAVAHQVGNETKNQGRGRPRCVEKNQAILEAATALFLENGFDGTSMDEVARRAGVSKQTVYSHFAGKEQLFAASTRAKIEEHYPENVLSRVGAHSLESDLRTVSDHIAELMLGEEAIAMFRLLVERGGKGPDLAELFWQSGPLDMLDSLKAFLGQWCERGELDIPDLELAAMQLVSLLKGGLHYRLAIGLVDRVDRATLDAHVTNCIDAFLKLYKSGR